MFILKGRAVTRRRRPRFQTTHQDGLPTCSATCPLPTQTHDNRRPHYHVLADGRSTYPWQSSPQQPVCLDAPEAPRPDNASESPRTQPATPLSEASAAQGGPITPGHL